VVCNCCVQLFSERCERPYAGLSAEQTAVYVVTGGRLGRPVGCDDDLYALMTSCWRRRAQSRPSAGVIHRRLVALQRCSATRHRCAASATTTLPAPPPLPLRPSDTSSSNTPQSPCNDDVTSVGDVTTRSAAVRIRNSFRKFVTSRKSRLVTATSESSLTSPTTELPDE